MSSDGTTSATDRHVSQARDGTYERLMGQHARSLRKARGLSQQILAKRAGLSTDTIRRLEHGSFSPSMATINGLCRGLAIQLSTLFVSFELQERDLRDEIFDALGMLTEAQQEGLLLFLHSPETFVVAIRTGQGTPRR